MRLFTILSLLIFALSANAQQRLAVDLIATSPTKTHIRGMSVPSDDVIWVSGSNGTVGKSVEGGKTFRWMIVPGYEKRDFRDIEAFDSSVAIIMAVENPAYILKTIDGGKTWKKVFERTMEGMFLCSMDFKNKKEGICIGDPLNLTVGRKLFYIVRTNDGGDTWAEAPLYQMPPAEQGEIIFSASGTNISFLDHPEYEYAFITGGTVSTLYFIARGIGNKHKGAPVPVVQGSDSKGGFSFATDKQKRFYVIGGDYKVPRDYFDVFTFSTDVGKKWGTPFVGGPMGYRSCIKIIENKTLVACGPSGVDIAFNAHEEWKRASLESYNVCMVTLGKDVFLAGDNGRIGKLAYKK